MKIKVAIGAITQSLAFFGSALRYAALLLFTPFVWAQPTAVSNWSLDWLQGFEFKSDYLSLQADCEQGFAKGIESSQQSHRLHLTVQHASWSMLCHEAQLDADGTVSNHAAHEIDSGNYQEKAAPLSVVEQLRLLAVTPRQQSQLQEIVTQLKQLPLGDYDIKRLDLYTPQGLTSLSFNLQVNKAGITAHLQQQENTVTLLVDWQQQALTLQTSASDSLLKPWIAAWPQGLKGTFNVNYQAPLDALWQGSFGLGAQQVRFLPWLQDGQFSAQGKLDAKALQLKLRKLSLTGRAEPAVGAKARFHLSSERPLVMTPDKLSAKLQMSIDNASWQGNALPETDLSLSFDSDFTRWHGQWQLASLRQVIEGSYAWQQGLSVKLIPGYLYLPDMLAAAPKYKALAKTALTQGKLHYQGKLFYDFQRQSGQASGQLQLRELTGLINDFAIQNGQLSMVHEYKIEQNQLKTLKEKNQLAIDELNIGVPVSVIKSDWLLRQGDIKVSQFNGFLLGGSVSLSDFEPFKLGMTKVHFAGIQLAALMDYGQLPGAQATGLLDASIPLLNETDGFHIYDGQISARAPGGKITIPPSDAVQSITSTNKGVEFVFKVLENLSYSQLNGKLNYKPSGETDIKVSLVGRSPQISATRPIEFNYSHQENLLQLLRSLRFANELERSLEEKYK
ncbi:intermembrane phospholipid transport protein YdbH family protein [Motilimonas pumila]|uniref:Uncharacterized protein n=1 Tax=Motilimonas pumila TaxID=2303987 RepID=A0A418YIB1_9GAMM|nr:YdbH domain-containing protein [Motilimonas pumila]RJG49961.1 hypothetical protein D1Z90_04770 [Motilimonas pumila]